MATTTASAIRTEVMRLIADITPSVHAHQRFQQHREELPIRPWAEAHPEACLRRVSVRFGGSTEPPAVNDTRVQEVSDTMEIVVAYPVSWRHGGRQQLGLDDVIADDARLIEAAVGPPGYAAVASLVAPATVLWEQSNEREESGPVQFSVLRYRVDYFRSLS